MFLFLKMQFSYLFWFFQKNLIQTPDKIDSFVEGDFVNNLILILMCLLICGTLFPIYQAWDGNKIYVELLILTN